MGRARRVQRRGVASGGKRDRGRVPAQAKKVSHARRREEALQEVREEQARVDAWIESQATGTDDYVIDLAETAPTEPETPARVQIPAGELIEVVFTTGITSDDPWDGMLPMDAGSIVKRLDWSLGDARQLVRQGYTPERAATVTGWPAALTEDVRIGKWA